MFSVISVIIILYLVKSVRLQSSVKEEKQISLVCSFNDNSAKAYETACKRTTVINANIII